MYLKGNYVFCSTKTKEKNLVGFSDSGYASELNLKFE